MGRRHACLCLASALNIFFKLNIEDEQLWQHDP